MRPSGALRLITMIHTDAHRLGPYSPIDCGTHLAVIASLFGHDAPQAYISFEMASWIDAHPTIVWAIKDRVNSSSRT